jgi:hypothetical protein
MGHFSVKILAQEGQFSVALNNFRRRSGAIITVTCDMLDS